MALVELRDVTKTYRKGDQVIKPLDGLDLDVDQGELTSLMGASGSGKSTLLNLIAGIDRPDSGSVKVGGAEIAGLAIGLGIGFVAGVVPAWKAATAQIVPALRQL